MCREEHEEACQSGGTGWYTFNFQVHRSPEEDTKWWVDIFILDNILRDILADNSAKVPLWRIHRRAPRDDRGHEFTLECCTEREVADLMDKRVNESPGYVLFSKEGLVTKYYRGDPTALPDGLCSVDWPAEIKKAWPYYMHGVSEMFLEFIEGLKGRIPDFPDTNADWSDMARITKCYRALHDELTRLWYHYACDAFFHHASSIFAYQPVVVNARISGWIMSF